MCSWYYGTGHLGILLDGNGGGREYFRVTEAAVEGTWVLGHLEGKGGAYRWLNDARVL